MFVTFGDDIVGGDTRPRPVKPEIDTVSLFFSDAAYSKHSPVGCTRSAGQFHKSTSLEIGRRVTSRCRRRVKFRSSVVSSKLRPPLLLHGRYPLRFWLFAPVLFELPHSSQRLLVTHSSECFTAKVATNRGHGSRFSKILTTLVRRCFSFLW